MNGETERDASGLTTDTLKLVMDGEIRRIDDRHTAFLDSYARDQAKANEFRAALDDLGRTMATRRELEAALTAINQRIDTQALQGAELRSRLDVGPAGLGQVQAYQQQQAGRQAGIGASVGAIVVAVTAASGLIGIVVVLANVLTKG